MSSPPVISHSSEVVGSLPSALTPPAALLRRSPWARALRPAPNRFSEATNGRGCQLPPSAFRTKSAVSGPRSSTRMMPCTFATGTQGNQ